MYRISLLLALVAISLLLVACGTKEEVYGSGVNPAAPVITVQDAFFNKDLLETEVTMEGFIQTQCTSNGCWFMLKDDTGQIFVDLSRHSFSLPARLGHDARATGTLTTYNNNLLLVASGVVLK
ncbi:nucleic acid binding OB-fold tRNA/helicase-type [Desulfurispirillum indicum S5]|uniref:Nucleic acid binding OB-fold tRNA/helicase-type n=1 Tax=Desulfurispirillum indicum (strain ATCC BAA-1389 / DSM 22839 / S5) TaxID=653733 RepID=E6W2R2_DESIS|nr:DNA-binding protein [Desulfurispirillum indicum]ADU65646.1 nucleic acid binding OB-fold tRNA/helicase-type [Desulfurispirillum indicum S5]